MSEQLRLLPECRNECRSALHGAQVAAGPVNGVLEVRAAVVRHRVMLQISADAFDGVELWSVSGQGLEGDLTALGLHMRAHEFGAVRLQAIPDDQTL